MPKSQADPMEIRPAQMSDLAGIRNCAEAVELYTNVKMTENLSIYPSLAYKEVGLRHEDGFDRVFFRKTLRPPVA